MLDYPVSLAHSNGKQSRESELVNRIQYICIKFLFFLICFLNKLFKKIIDYSKISISSEISKSNVQWSFVMLDADSLEISCLVDSS